MSFPLPCDNQNRTLRNHNTYYKSEASPIITGGIADCMKIAENFIKRCIILNLVKRVENIQSCMDNTRKEVYHFSQSLIVKAILLTGGLQKEKNTKNRYEFLHTCKFGIY
ncbi:MAG: hypothetical protein ABIP79_14035 [Chitinophagaceae bacterium]